jgi:hypothetical protein
MAIDLIPPSAITDIIARGWGGIEINQYFTGSLSRFRIGPEFPGHGGLPHGLRIPLILISLIPSLPFDVRADFWRPLRAFL